MKKLILFLIAIYASPVMAASEVSIIKTFGTNSDDMELKYECAVSKNLVEIYRYRGDGSKFPLFPTEHSFFENQDLTALFKKAANENFEITAQTKAEKLPGLKIKAISNDPKKGIFTEMILFEDDSYLKKRTGKSSQKLIDAVNTLCVVE